MDEPEVPKILVEFDDHHSTLFHTRMVGITPMMMLTLADWLQLYAKMLLNEEIKMQLQATAQQHIAVPDSGIVKPQTKILTKDE